MEELIKILEEIKEHQMQTEQPARTTTVYKFADKAIHEALSIANIVEGSEQLFALAQYMCEHQNNLDGKTAKDYLQDFLSQ